MVYESGNIEDMMSLDNQFNVKAANDLLDLRFLSIFEEENNGNESSTGTEDKLLLNTATEENTTYPFRTRKSSRSFSVITRAAAATTSTATVATATAATSTNMRTTRIDNNSTQQQDIDTDLSQEEMLREIITTKNAEQIYEEIKEGLTGLKNEIEEVQRTIDNTTSTTRREAQEEMLVLQELLRDTEYSEDEDSKDGT